MVLLDSFPIRVEERTISWPRCTANERALNMLLSFLVVAVWCSNTKHHQWTPTIYDQCPAWYIPLLTMLWIKFKPLSLNKKTPHRLQGNLKNRENENLFFLLFFFTLLKEGSSLSSFRYAPHRAKGRARCLYCPIMGAPVSKPKEFMERRERSNTEYRRQGSLAMNLVRGLFFRPTFAALCCWHLFERSF